ncbi:MAG TPA: ubiquinol-cytochrome c reductase iron-sulfur subunit [Spongiibacteraceae bacterium]|nr:ubiquinol-cytochrome c reductase iron-sulfur subunit [Spongiibacteraceae bacterium]
MSNDGVNTGRRRFLVAATTVVGAAGAVGVAVPFVGSWQPSAKAKAAGAPVKADVSKIEPGQMVVIEWRGKPVYVVRRTKEALESIKKVDGELKDPNSTASLQPKYIKGEFRAIKDEYLVLLGVCTHLGCAPKYFPEVGSVSHDWLGGFFCPCHGSKFDLAGRVFKGVPAPSNLEVPPYRYVTDTVIEIGVDQEKA